MEALVEFLKTSTPSIETLQVPLLDSLVHSEREVDTYSYEKLFSAAMNDPILILHSSGSTGKLHVALE